jgi:hypothetical protein
VLFSFASLAHYFYCTMMHYVNHIKSNIVLVVFACSVSSISIIPFVCLSQFSDRDREERGRDNKETKGAVADSLSESQMLRFIALHLLA